MAELLTRHFGYVHSLCRRMLRDPSEAEDARQDALIQAARKIATFDGRSAFRTWLHTVTRNVCLNAIRSASRRAVPVDELPQPAPRHREQDQVATRLDVESALAALSPQNYDPIVLRYICDLDYQQIADLLNRPLNTVRSQIRRGRQELMDLLGNLPAPVRCPKTRDRHESTPVSGTCPAKEGEM